MKSIGKTFAIFLVLLALVLINTIGHLLPTQADFTADRLYTLSPGSRSLLGKIEEPIQLTYYYSSDLAQVPPMFKAYAGRIEAFLRQYVRASNGMIRLQVVNLKPDTSEEEAATRVGIQGQTLRSGEVLYLGLVATQADQTAVIPVFDPNRERLLEYDLTRMIHEIQLLDKPRIGIITQLNLFADFSNPMAMDPRNPPRDAVLIDELRRTFEVERVEGDELPEQLDVLALIHPGPLSEQLAYQVDQFLLSGKPVFVAVDPSNAVQRASMPPQMMFMGGGQTSSNLPRLFPRWGIQFETARVVGDHALAATVETGRGPRLRYPIWLHFREFETDQPTVAALNNVVLIEAGNFSLNPESTLTLTPLLQTSDESGLLDTGALLGRQPDEVGRELRADGLRRNVAGIVRGTFPSAFPDGPPKPADGEEPPPERVAAHRTESASTSTLIMIADADFLTDPYSVQRYQIFGGHQAIQPINDNLALASNLLELLAGSSELLTLRGGGTATRTFTRVEELARAAQEASDERLKQLEQRLEEVNQQLSQLQQQVGDARALVASPEAQAAIERFREQQADLRAERREIRKALREDIEALGLRLGIVNLVPVPLAVALLGFLVLFRRGRRRAA